MKRPAGAVRTTLTLDADVALQVNREMRRTGMGLKVVINQVLRRGFGSGSAAGRVPPFKVEPHALSLRPGIDRDRLNQLVDELDARETSRRP